MDDRLKQSYRPGRGHALSIVSIELNIVSGGSSIVAKPLSIVSNTIVKYAHNANYQCFKMIYGKKIDSDREEKKRGLKSGFQKGMNKILKSLFTMHKPFIVQCKYEEPRWHHFFKDL